MRYDAQQPGGLTDAMFNQDPRQSIRTRNWFRVDWRLGAITLDYRLSERTKLNMRTFGLAAQRDALGFLGFINRVDPLEERDLISGDFNNFGNETRLLHHYQTGQQLNVLLVGARLYRGRTRSIQGSANAESGPSYELLNPEEADQSDYTFPSTNISLFAENIFNLSDRLSITPGIRFEYFDTESEGYFFQRAFDLSGELIFEQQNQEYDRKQRSLVLLGLGVSYKPTEQLEIYGNYSDNYRAINFNDIRVVNSNILVDPDIEDEKGFNADLGIRGTLFNKKLKLDASLFYLAYRTRIGLVQVVENFSVRRLRTNVSSSRSFGLELFAETNILEWLGTESNNKALSLFTNLALINARYASSEETAYEGNKVELVPEITFKGGLMWTHKAVSTTLQLSYTGEHFTDATNATLSSTAVTGLIPAYTVMDLSTKYRINKHFQAEAGINNLTDARYFTRRATGYPGPGIIPADGRSFYLSLQATF